MSCPDSSTTNVLIKAGFGELNVQLDYWGGNLIFVRNRSGGYLALIALRPDGDVHCRLYLGVFVEKRETVDRVLSQSALL